MTAPAIRSACQSHSFTPRLIQAQAGFELNGYKSTPLLWRIQQRMDQRRVRTFSDYEALLRDDAAELETLIRNVPIHVTDFFRDPEGWDILAEHVIKPLFVDREKSRVIRAWTAACSSGEEAYSLAILLNESAEASGKSCEFQVFATDAAPEVAARASRGI